MLLQIIAFIGWLVLAIWLIGRISTFKNSAFKKQTLWAFLLLKIAAGAALIWIYSSIYPNRQTADIFKFYDDALVINESLTEHPAAYFRLMSGIDDSASICLPYLERMHNWAPQSERWLEYAQTRNYNYFLSNRLITRIHVFLLPLSRGEIYTHLIFFNFISLLSMVFFLNAFKVQNALPALVFVLLPSTLLWCSGLLKDSIVLSALCFILGGWENYKARKSRLASILLILLCILAVLYTKFYILAGLAAYLGFELLLLLLPKVKASLLAFGIVGIACGFAASGAGKPVLDVLCGKREEALKAAVFGEAQNQVFYNPVDADFRHVMHELPAALWNAFFSPMPNAVGQNVLVLLASIENTFLLLILLAFVVKGRSFFRQRNSFSWVFFLLSLAFIIGFTSPVTGGLVRYKTAFISFAVLLWLNHLPLNWRGLRLLMKNRGDYP